MEEKLLKSEKVPVTVAKSKFPTEQIKTCSFEMARSKSKTKFLTKNIKKEEKKTWKWMLTDILYSIWLSFCFAMKNLAKINI